MMRFVLQSNGLVYLHGTAVAWIENGRVYWLSVGPTGGW